MVVDDLHIVGVTISPFETDAPLVIDSNAMLAGTVAAQFLKTIRRRDTEISQCRRSIEHAQLS